MRASCETTWPFTSRTAAGSSAWGCVLPVGVGRAGGPHAQIASTIDMTNQGLLSLPSAVDPGTQRGLEVLNGLVNQQSALIAYLNDFRFMMVLTIIAIPLLILVRPPRRNAAPAAAGGDALH